MGQKQIWVQHILGSKKFWVKKKILAPKILAPKNFGSAKCGSKKKFLVKTPEVVDYSQNLHTPEMGDLLMKFTYT